MLSERFGYFPVLQYYELDRNALLNLISVFSRYILAGSEGFNRAEKLTFEATSDDSITPNPTESIYVRS